MSDIDPLLASQEARLQQNTAFQTEVSAQMAALQEQLRQVGEKVEEGFQNLKADIGAFRTDNSDDHDAIKAEVEALKLKTEKQEQNITLLLDDRATRERQVKTVRRIGYGAVVAVVTGILAKWGESIYTWFVQLWAKG